MTIDGRMNFDSIVLKFVNHINKENLSFLPQQNVIQLSLDLPLWKFLLLLSQFSLCFHQKSQIAVFLLMEAKKV